MKSLLERHVMSVMGENTNDRISNTGFDYV